MTNNSATQELRWVLRNLAIFLLEKGSNNEMNGIQSSVKIIVKIKLSINAIKDLIKKGASSYVVEGKENQNALHKLARIEMYLRESNAVVYRKYIQEIMELFLQQKGDVNMQDKEGNTAPHYALSTSEGSIVARQLVQAGCQLDIKNEAGDTPLHIVAFHASFSDSIFLLLRAGANPFLRNQKNYLPIKFLNELSSGSSNIPTQQATIKYYDQLIQGIIQKLNLEQLQFEGLTPAQNRYRQQLVAEQWRRLGSRGQRVLCGLLKLQHPDSSDQSYLSLCQSYLENLSENIFERLKTLLPFSTEPQATSVMKELVIKSHRLPYELKEMILKEIFEDAFLEKEIFEEDLKLFLIQMPENDTRPHPEVLFSMLVKHLSHHLNPNPQPIPEQTIQNDWFRPSC